MILQWKERPEVANPQLKLSEWPVGAAIADSVIRDMRERLGGGEASADLLAAAFLFRAIGRAGLDDETSRADRTIHPCTRRPIPLSPSRPSNPFASGRLNQPRAVDSPSA